MKSYKFDIIANTLTLSAAFVDAMNNPKSEEYALVCKFREDFPSLNVVRKTHASPSRYHNKIDGSITARNRRNGLTYKRMEGFMSSIPNGTNYLAAYWELREKAEAMCVSPYSAVSAWFIKQFPDYRPNPLSYLDEKNSPKVIDFSAILEEAKAKEKPSVNEAEGEKDA